jgi:hypothetical protein
MPRRGRATIALALALLATCLGTASAWARPSRPALTIRERVLGSGDLSGYEPALPIRVVRSPFVWAQRGLPYRAVQEAERLRGAGFVAGVSEELTRPDAHAQRQGLSMVVQFRTARAARAEQTHLVEASSDPTTTVRSFAVPGIPGADGWDASAVGSDGVNVAFSDGRFTYVVAAGVAYEPGSAVHVPTTDTTPDPPSRASVIRAARKLYARVHGRRG